MKKTDFLPLYVNGKRDRARRYIAPDGSIVSRRQFLKLTGGSPEERAVKRWEQGDTAKKPEYSLKKTKRKQIQWRFLKFPPDYKNRGKYPKSWQLWGEYLIVCEKGQHVVTGFSKVRKEKNLSRALREAGRHAISKLIQFKSGECKVNEILDHGWIRIVDNR